MIAIWKVGLFEFSLFILRATPLTQHIDWFCLGTMLIREGLQAILEQVDSINAITSKVEVGCSLPFALTVRLEKTGDKPFVGNLLMVRSEVLGMVTVYIFLLILRDTKFNSHLMKVDLGYPKFGKSMNPQVNPAVSASVLAKSFATLRKPLFLWLSPWAHRFSGRPSKLKFLLTWPQFLSGEIVKLVSQGTYTGALPYDKAVLTSVASGEVLSSSVWDFTHYELPTHEVNLVQNISAARERLFSS